MSQATNFVNALGNQFRQTVSNIADHVRQAASEAQAAYRSAAYGLREEVPFERWFFHHGFHEPISNTKELISAHIWAVLATIEGAVRTTAEALSYLFSLVFEQNHAGCHLEVLQAQAQGCYLSFLAIFSPNFAKQKAYNEGNSLIGEQLPLSWGTIYNGRLTAPLWKIECRFYPWADRPATERL